MVGALNEDPSSDASRHGLSQSMVLERTNTSGSDDEVGVSKGQPSTRQHWALPRQKMGVPISSKHSGGDPQSEAALLKDMDMMKERFSKLLLGEDMSGGGKGVSSALALSNAITNLAASAFAEQRKLEPMKAENRARWKKEIDWLLSVTDHIVEFAPSQQKLPNGMIMEVMTTKQRSDLQSNIPALRKLDNMLLDCLDNFKDQHEFHYVSKDANDTEKGTSRDEKWWLPTVKVPPNGLSDVTKKWILFQKDSVNQVLKAAMAINAQVLCEMEIPEDYMDSLPKNGRGILGDAIYKNITDESFDPEQLLSIVDLSSEHKIVNLKNRIEASVIIWMRKMINKDSGKSPWGSTVSIEKREMFEDRAETILQIIKQRYPGISQSSLDISKIQFNQDVGHSILESYSRILESLAHTVLSRIDDVLYADSLAQNPSLANAKRNPLTDVKLTSMNFPNVEEAVEKINSKGSPTSMTLLDFVGWSEDQDDDEDEEDENAEGEGEQARQETAGKIQVPYLSIPKNSYLS